MKLAETIFGFALAPLMTMILWPVVALPVHGNDEDTNSSGAVVINEIFYHSPNDSDALEWIEILNTSDQPVDISGWGFSQGVQYRFPDGTQLEPLGFLVICRNLDEFQRHYQTPGVVGEFQNGLSNKGERVELSDAEGKVVDSVKYQDSAPWPTAADGYASSLERICPAGASDQATNWAASPPPKKLVPAGTPGRRNANYSPVPPPVISELTFAPQQPSPGQSIRISARVPDWQQLNEMVLKYRTVSTGNPGEETELQMTHAGDGKYVAEIPGQPGPSLLRFRVLAKGRNHTARYQPHQHGLRPAISVFVDSEPEVANIPVARIINLDPRDAMVAAKYRQRAILGVDPGGRGNQVYSRVQRQLNSGLDLQRNWFGFTVDADLNFETVQKLREVFIAKLAERDGIVMELFTAEDLEAASQEVRPRISEFRENLRKQVGAVVTEEQVQLASQAGKDRPQFPPWASNVFPLADVWFALNVRYEFSPDQFMQLRSSIKQTQASWASLHSEAIEVRNITAFNQFRRKAEKLKSQLMASAEKSLDRNQTDFLKQYFESQPENRPLQLGGDPPPLNPRGQSAVIFFDPETRQFEVFDFVNVKRRSEGYKIRFHKDRPYRGMTVVNVVFEYQDRFVLAEYLAYDLYRRVGNAACLADFVRLSIDGHSEGYYLVFEQPNRAFLRRNGLNPDGDLYKINWRGRNAETTHEKQTNLHTGHAALFAVLKKLGQSEGDQQWKIIQDHFNVDQVINYFAINMVLTHWDGFFNNYFVYHDLDGSGKIEMYPWDQDKTWGFHDSFGEEKIFYDMGITFGMQGDPSPHGGTRMDGRHWWRRGGYFSRPLLANPEFRTRYLKRIKEILDDEYSPEKTFPVIDELANRLRPEVKIRALALKQDPEKALARFERNIASFKEHLIKRTEFLLAEEELQQIDQ